MSYTTYGNEIWYKARNNSEKTAIVLHSDAVKNFTNILDDAGINYYGFNIEEKGIGKLTVLKNNLDFVKQLVGSEVAENSEQQNLRSILRRSKTYSERFHSRIYKRKRIFPAVQSQNKRQH